MELGLTGLRVLVVVVVVSDTGMVVRVASVRLGETNTGAQFVGMCVLVGGVW